jgi:CBS-domain-containing membrane protein
VRSILLSSAGFGSLFGSLAHQIVPTIGVSEGAFALVAMAAEFGAATRASFTAIVFVFELTGDYQAILPLMLASVVADLVAAALLRESLMTEKLARRGLRVHTEYEVDALRTTYVRTIMSAPVETIEEWAPLGLARERLGLGRHGALPVVDAAGRCVAIVTRGDLLRVDAPDGDALADHAASDVVTVAPGDLAITAVQRMTDEGVDHIPVVDGERLVGICTRTDILRVRRHRFDLDRRQQGLGWRRRQNNGAGAPISASPG